jgi:hypothetical protein
VHDDDLLVGLGDLGADPERQSDAAKMLTYNDLIDQGVSAVGGFPTSRSGRSTTTAQTSCRHRC